MPVPKLRVLWTYNQLKYAIKGSNCCEETKHGDILEQVVLETAQPLNTSTNEIVDTGVCLRLHA